MLRGLNFYDIEDKVLLSALGQTMDEVAEETISEFKYLQLDSEPTSPTPSSNASVETRKMRNSSSPKRGKKKRNNKRNSKRKNKDNSTPPKDKSDGLNVIHASKAVAAKPTETRKKQDLKLTPNYLQPQAILLEFLAQNNLDDYEVFTNSSVSALASDFLTSRYNSMLEATRG